MYDVIPVEVNKDIDELLGGYAEWQSKKLKNYS
jgi:hypothetical protein